MVCCGLILFAYDSHPYSGMYLFMVCHQSTKHVSVFGSGTCSHKLLPKLCHITEIFTYRKRCRYCLVSGVRYTGSNHICYFTMNVVTSKPPMVWRFKMRFSHQFQPPNNPQFFWWGIHLGYWPQVKLISRS